MSVWPVFVDFWQQECCGRPFAVGDSVEWTVVLIDGREQGWPDELLVDARVELRQYPEQLPERGSVAVSDDGVQAWWQSSDPAGSVLELRGALGEDHHSLALVYTRGTVRRIQVITQRYEPAPDGVMWATWQGWHARDVDRSPRHFASDVEPVEPVASRGSGWYPVRVKSAETGLLVSFEPEPPTQPPVLQVRSVEREDDEPPSLSEATDPQGGASSSWYSYAPVGGQRWRPSR